LLIGSSHGLRPVNQRAPKAGLPHQQGRVMTSIDKTVSSLGDRINAMSVPDRAASAPESLSSLIARLNMAKLRYQPGGVRF
jgi:hypothetical protein